MKLSMSSEKTLEPLIGSDVLNLLKCNICWEFFTEPTILPCGHTFCFKCLNEMGKHAVKNAKFVQSFSDILIFCPNCRHSVHYKDVKSKRNGVRFNYSLNSIKDSLKDVKLKEKRDVSTNTDTDACIDRKLDRMEAQFNSIFSSISQRGAGCVINDACEEIREIRKNLSADVTSDGTETNSQAEISESSYQAPSGANVPEKPLTSRESESIERDHLKDLQMLYFKFNPSQSSRIQTSYLQPCPKLPVNHPINYFGNSKSIGKVYSQSSKDFLPVSVNPGNFDPAILSYGGPMTSEKNSPPFEFNVNA